MTFESIMNFKINDLVLIEDKKGRVDKIAGTNILVRFADGSHKVIHYSFLKIITTHRIPNDYHKWSEQEEQILRSGKTPKELSKELNRNIQNIYNKMKRLGIPRKTKKP